MAFSIAMPNGFSSHWFSRLSDTAIVLLVHESMHEILKVWTPITKWISYYLTSIKPLMQSLIANSCLKQYIMVYNQIHIIG